MLEVRCDRRFIQLGDLPDRNFVAVELAQLDGTVVPVLRGKMISKA